MNHFEYTFNDYDEDKYIDRLHERLQLPDHSSELVVQYMRVMFINAYLQGRANYVGKSLAYADLVKPTPFNPDNFWIEQYISPVTKLIQLDPLLIKETVSAIESVIQEIYEDGISSHLKQLPNSSN